MKYEFAKSLSGHDKDRIYLILARNGRYAYLADGKAHTKECPKKKNEKHYQVIKDIPEEIRMRLMEQEPLQDEAIRLAVRDYERSISRRL